MLLGRGCRVVGKIEDPQDPVPSIIYSIPFLRAITCIAETVAALLEKQGLGNGAPGLQVILCQSAQYSTARISNMLDTNMLGGRFHVSYLSCAILQTCVYILGVRMLH